MMETLSTNIIAIKDPAGIWTQHLLITSQTLLPLSHWMNVKDWETRITYSITERGVHVHVHVHVATVSQKLQWTD